MSVDSGRERDLERAGALPAAQHLPSHFVHTPALGLPQESPCRLARREEAVGRVLARDPHPGARVELGREPEYDPDRFEPGVEVRRDSLQAPQADRVRSGLLADLPNGTANGPLPAPELPRDRLPDAGKRPTGPPAKRQELDPSGPSPEHVNLDDAKVQAGHGRAG